MSRIPLLVVLALLLAACATTGGTGFEPVREEAARQEEKENDTTEEPTKQAKDTDPAEKQPAEAETEEPDYGIRVITSPSRAEVLINREFVGRTPVTVTDLPTGTYRVVIDKQGYHEEVRWVELTKNTLVILDVNLELVTGYLSVSTKPQNAVVHADGERLDSTVSELPVGDYRLTARAFGYEPASRTVTVRDGDTTNVHLVLSVAEFDVEGFEASRTAFSPENPGQLGTTRFSFRVTAPGQGTITVYGEEDAAIWTHRFQRFTTWQQSVRWSGRDSGGRPLPDGDYRVRLTADGARAGKSITRELVVTIDRSRSIAFRSLFSGTPGLLFAPTGEVLPLGSYQVGGAFVGHRSRSADDDESLTYRFPVQGAFRVGLGEYVEAGGQATAYVQDTQELPFAVGAYAQRLMYVAGTAPSLSLGAVAKGTYYRGSNTDTLTNFFGVGLALPLHVSASPLGLVLAPEVFASPTDVAYGTETPVEGPNVWLYARAGAYADWGNLIAGASAAVRSQPLRQELGVQFPVVAGLELHWMVPGTYAYLSALVSGEFFPTGYYLMGGGAVGFIY